jgi:uncharacterized protein with NRDE domain
MCLCVFSYKNHAKFRLILALNRDEFLDRPTLGLHFWKDKPNILAGRDLQQGGTWLGINRNGNLAFLTNYRDLKHLKSNAPSRGALTVDFLDGNQEPFLYLSALVNQDQYNGFNLLVADRERFFYFSNMTAGILEVEPGIHGISNHLLNSEWDKVTRKKQQMENLILGDFAIDDLFNLMSDRVEASDESLPDTGLSKDLELKLSAPFISTLPDYGTISTSVILITHQGEIEFHERRFGLNGVRIGNEAFRL